MFHQTHIIWIVTQGPMAHVFFVSAMICPDFRMSSPNLRGTFRRPMTSAPTFTFFSGQTKSHEKTKTAESSDELLVALRQNFELSNQIPINNLLEFMEKSEQSSCFIIDTTQSIWNTKLLAVLTLAETPTLKNWNF